MKPKAKYSKPDQTTDSEQLQEQLPEQTLEQASKQTHSVSLEQPESLDIWEIPEDRFCRKIAEDDIIVSDILQYYTDSRI
ncbi:MAG: hypothetical protein LBP87_07135, partial [Planctomycetaceae bacterium]|nr:hypothetical protein [Planctomycetaceae bacterium]